jgi:hypothetical protein
MLGAISISTSNFFMLAARGEVKCYERKEAVKSMKEFSPKNHRRIKFLYSAEGLRVFAISGLF